MTKSVPLVFFDISHAQLLWKYAKKIYVNGLTEFKEHIKKSNIRIMTPDFSFVFMGVAAPGNKIFLYFIRIDGSYKSKKAYYFAVSQYKEVYFCTKDAKLGSRHTDMGNGLYRGRRLRQWAA